MGVSASTGLLSTAQVSTTDEEWDAVGEQIFEELHRSFTIVMDGRHVGYFRNETADVADWRGDSWAGLPMVPPGT